MFLKPGNSGSTKASKIHMRITFWNKTVGIRIDIQRSNFCQGCIDYPVNPVDFLKTKTWDIAQVFLKIAHIFYNKIRIHLVLCR